MVIDHKKGNTFLTNLSFAWIQGEFPENIMLKIENIRLLVRKIFESGLYLAFDNYMNNGEWVIFRGEIN